MSESRLIANTPLPRTRESLARDLAALGVRPGMTLLVHSSLRALGWVCGGPLAVIQALMDAVTEAGALVMPTHSSYLSDPEKWVAPPVPATWIDVIRESMPAYDPAVTPTWYMGAVPELFRTMPGVRRSDHPSVSFAAWGAGADEVTRGHRLSFGLGETSPLARVYDRDGWVLLLGVGHDVNTSLHLAECRAGIRAVVKEAAPVWVDGKRVWRTYDEIDLDNAPFTEIGEAFEREGEVRTGLVGSAKSKLMPQRSLVDFGARWFAEFGGQIGG